ncbi:MAG: SufD family Fe-S cluster assembly protein [Puniceicoccales bacterium]|jgi:Fe-S cluster assembly scaffold protein SufB|nr:SufD family Fe-S cluster assembly protein [Puniceicoccales bacterium]
MANYPFELCTFLREEKVSKRVEESTPDHLDFHFCIEQGGCLQVDFRPREHLTLTVAFVIGEDAEAIVRILYRGQGDSTFKCCTLQKHIGNGGISSIEVKYVGEDRARFDYRGKIDVPENIAGVKVVQKNKNLVLSEHVRVDTEPAMDIRSKDVECFHGAAIGGMDCEILQYFSTRGIGENMAKEIFIDGFLS